MVGDSDPVTVLLGGDVMLGRGVDQVLPHPENPVLREPHVGDARRYVELAEQLNRAIPRPVEFAWPWGDALVAVDDLAPDVRLINLETSITAGDEFSVRKSVHYRMHPDNVPALAAFRPDVCALANNHVLDFGHRGLLDTVDALAAAGIRSAGAGVDLDAARRPAAMRLPGERGVVVCSVATRSSGVPSAWGAGRGRPGVWLVEELSAACAAEIAAKVMAHKQVGDVAIVSVHWGPNWGYGVGRGEIEFAHRLIDAGVDLVHGHSAHHPRPVEIYRGRPVLYGCGDVIDDYEGIKGYESYRPELRLLYLATLDPRRGGLVGLRMLPLRVRRMRLERTGRADAEWLRATVEHISRGFDIRVARGPEDLLSVLPRRVRG
ncbi:CapA family protein [Nocardia arthritidis]|uniref:Capsule synthesis protein CapA domain-containing protein n=1 Tax=Nocardia arthritidis TaxID=228602 RepID=A0A6G9YH50_9NOCA|nr:CapA family protein [Nocardia arthritidis]QIS12387.1 hypothetical protein F5544_22630 [Nocardia arthritidis]